MSKIPSWKLERLHLGELDDPALEAQARAELEELSRSDAEILAAHPPERVAAEIERRRRVAAARASLAAPRRNLFVLVPVGAIAVAAALTLLPRQQQVGDASDLPPEVILTKGSAALRVYRQTDAGAERLENRSRTRAGDRLQIATVGGSDRFGVVVSVDGRGAVTLHFPGSEDGSTALAGKETALPSSYELDDAPAFERFFLVSGPSPISVTMVLTAARDLVNTGRAADAPLSLPRELHQTSVLLRKVSP